MPYVFVAKEPEGTSRRHALSRAGLAARDTQGGGEVERKWGVTRWHVERRHGDAVREIGVPDSSSGD